MKKLKVIDLFAGAGGLSNGFEQTGGFEIIGAVELNKAALSTFKKNHPEKDGSKLETFPDIKQLDFSKISSFNNIPREELVVIGGPPCQGFSNANRQQNYLISGNNQLVKEYVRAIRQLQPIAFVLENVKSMESDKHKFFVTNGNLQLASGEFDKYSTEEYLKNELKVQLEKTNLVLLKSTNNSVAFKNAIYNIVEKHTQISPLIKGTDTLFLSRLRSLQRRLKNIDYIEAKDKAEANIFLRIANIICKYNDRTVLPTINEAALIFQKIGDGEKLFSREVSEKIQNFITLNLLLLHLEELNQEDIKYDIREPEFKKGEWIVSVDVQSYNVVEFLTKSFTTEGYSIKKDVLDATHYGVPQQRKRFVIMGINEKILGKRVQVTMPKKLIGTAYTVYDAIASLSAYRPKKNVEDDQVIDISIEKRKRTNSHLEGYYTEGFTNTIVKNHVNTESRDTSLKRFKSLGQGQNFHDLSEDLKTNYADTSRTQNTVYLRLKYNEPSRTVVNVRKSMWIHPEIDRSISIREAARLQTFPDSFEFHGRKDEQYQQIGNAVPPLLARAVAEELLELLERKPERTIKEDLR